MVIEVIMSFIVGKMIGELKVESDLIKENLRLRMKFVELELQAKGISDKLELRDKDLREKLENLKNKIEKNGQ
jgi:hypothetical protein